MKLLGVCNSCNRGIPFGYLSVVTKWAVVLRGTMKVQTPEIVYCRECGSNLEGNPAYRRRHRSAAETAPESTKPSMKEVARKVWPLLNQAQGYTSIKLAEMAGLGAGLATEVKEVLKKLHSAKKVKFEEGRWWKA